MILNDMNIKCTVYRCKNRNPSLSVAEVLNLRFARSAFSGLVVATVAGLIVNQHFSQDLPLQKIAFRFKLWLVCLSFGLVLWLSLRLLHSCLAKSDEQVLLHTTCKQWTWILAAELDCVKEWRNDVTGLLEIYQINSNHQISKNAWPAGAGWIPAIPLDFVSRNPGGILNSAFPFRHFCYGATSMYSVWFQLCKLDTKSLWAKYASFPPQDPH